jgi:Tfp pilus assembly protein PilF
LLFLKLSKSRIVSVLSLSIMISACSSETPETKGAQHLERAQAYQNQGQYKAATIEYRNALKNSQNSEEAVLGFADMLNDMGRFQDALKLIDERGPEQRSDEIALERSESLIGLRKYRSADEEYDLLADKQSPAAQYVLAQVYLGQGNVSAAKTIFSDLLKQPENEFASKSKLGLALIYLGEGDTKQALELVASIANNSESYAKAQVLKAGIELNQDALEKAEATLTETLTQLPNTDTMLPEKALVLERLSYVLTRLGRSNEAYVYQKLLAEAFPGANEVSEKYQSAVESFKAQDLELAKSTLESILEEYPSHARSKQLLGVIAYLNGKTDEASNMTKGSL